MHFSPLTCVSFPEVRADHPLGSLYVVEILQSGVLLVERPPVVFPDKGEEAGPLVLPDGGPALAGDDELLTASVTVERPQEVSHSGAPQLSQLSAGLVTAVTFLTRDPPGRAGQRLAPVHLLLHRDKVQETGEGAGGGGRVPGADHRLGVEGLTPVLGGEEGEGVTDREVAPLQH